MDSSVDAVYMQFIKPLSASDRIILAERILKEFIEEQSSDTNSNRYELLKKFKGLSQVDSVVNEEDWYKQ